MLRRAGRQIGRRWCASEAPTTNVSVPPAVLRRGKASAFDPEKFTVPTAARVPSSIPRPSYGATGSPRGQSAEEYAEIKNVKQIDNMRRATALAANALALARETAKEGVSTDEVDRVVTDFVMARGGYPAGINYHGFPRSLCASPNEVALHGVPNTRKLLSGDIVNFDVTVFFSDAFGDCSGMVCVGDVDDDARSLVETTRQCLDESIQMVGPGVKLNSIGAFCQEFGSSRGFGVVADFCGHFIGSEMHMRPNVLHVPNGNALELRPGMTFTIEPIFIEGGDPKVVGPLEDGWTIVSRSGGWSAQWEHTILVTENGAEILTLPS